MVARPARALASSSSTEGRQHQLLPLTVPGPLPLYNACHGMLLLLSDAPAVTEPTSDTSPVPSLTPKASDVSLGPGAAERQRSVLSAHSGVARSVAAYQATFAEAIEDGVLTPTELNSLAERAGAVTQAKARMQAVSSAEAAAPVRLGSIAPC